MAFDLYLDDAGPRMRHAWIDTNEEAILSPDSRRYPQLARLLSEFYGAPRISPGQAAALMQEVIGRLLDEPDGAEGPLAEVGLRLILLFDQAQRHGLHIQCEGD
ncbi:hypothetical protein [Stenotrophomonas sp. HMWF003]|uniref:hypothetical protein n=1 Tax=Stenotrophomonas sp. HMWF003 TaxID=2056840 RepID=UPI000D4A3E06|nr:hypothetical protein [Stenotrophomonas sp. HMWF003]PTT63921.1 hypothetical protein DBR34_05640 [Stenotrophomonas sp. HMWF003]